MFKESARQLTPPIVWSGFRAIKNSLYRPSPHPDLFDGNGELFITAAEGATVYCEYGVGQSTIWIDRYTDAKIFSVDTSSDWIAKVSKSLLRKNHSLLFVDLGQIGDWGMPIDFSRRKYFHDYVNGPWYNGADADLVLIDGRFRVSCFLGTLLKGKAGTKIVFDDYTSRPHYHIVEDFVKPVEKSARQALFIVPEELDRVSVLDACNQFIMVRE